MKKIRPMNRSLSETIEDKTGTVRRPTDKQLGDRTCMIAYRCRREGLQSSESALHQF